MKDVEGGTFDDPQMFNLMAGIKRISKGQL